MTKIAPFVGELGIFVFRLSERALESNTCYHLPSLKKPFNLTVIYIIIYIQLWCDHLTSLWLMLMSFWLAFGCKWNARSETMNGYGRLQGTLRYHLCLMELATVMSERVAAVSLPLSLAVSVCCNPANSWNPSTQSFYSQYRVVLPSAMLVQKPNKVIEAPYSQTEFITPVQKHSAKIPSRKLKQFVCHVV